MPAKYNSCHCSFTSFTSFLSAWWPPCQTLTLATFSYDGHSLNSIPKEFDYSEIPANKEHHKQMLSHSCHHHPVPQFLATNHCRTCSICPCLCWCCLRLGAAPAFHGPPGRQTVKSPGTKKGYTKPTWPHWWWIQKRLTPFNFFSYLGSHAYLNLLERWQNWLRQTYWEKGMFIWSRIPAHLCIHDPFPITDRNYQLHSANDIQCLKWQVYPKIRIGTRQIIKTHFCMQMFGLLEHVFNKWAFKAWNGKAVFVICGRIIAVLSPLQ